MENQSTKIDVQRSVSSNIDSRLQAVSQFMEILSKEGGICEDWLGGSKPLLRETPPSKHRCREPLTLAEITTWNGTGDCQKLQGSQQRKEIDQKDGDESLNRPSLVFADKVRVSQSPSSPKLDSLGQPNCSVQTAFGRLNAAGPIGYLYSFNPNLPSFFFDTFQIYP